MWLVHGCKHFRLHCSWIKVGFLELFSSQGAHPLFEVVHGLLSRTDSAGPHSGSHAGNVLNSLYASDPPLLSFVSNPSGIVCRTSVDFQYTGLLSGTLWTTEFPFPTSILPQKRLLPDDVMLKQEGGMHTAPGQPLRVMLAASAFASTGSHSYLLLRQCWCY